MKDLKETETEAIKIEKTALVVIDLQNIVLNMEYSPHTSSELIQNTSKLVNAFTEKGGFVVLVKVAHVDEKDKPKINMKLKINPESFPKDWDNLVPEIANAKNAYTITKRRFGAFFGTDLDLQLRCRGIDTIVLCGVSTGFGVDTTAREAFQYGYNIIFVEDGMSASTKGEHECIYKYIFPKIGKIRTSEAVALSLI